MTSTVGNGDIATAVPVEADTDLEKTAGWRCIDVVASEFDTGYTASRTGLIVDHDVVLHSCPDSTCEVVGYLPILTKVRVGTMGTPHVL